MLGICCRECSAAQTREGKLGVGLFNDILSRRPQNVDITVWKTVPVKRFQVLAVTNVRNTKESDL